MSNDKTTLADAQPGGRVRLGDQAERARFEAWVKSKGISLYRGFPVDQNNTGYGHVETQRMWEAWQAAAVPARNCGHVESTDDYRSAFQDTDHAPYLVDAAGIHALEAFLTVAEEFRLNAQPYIEAINEGGNAGDDEISEVFDSHLNHAKGAISRSSVLSAQPSPGGQGDVRSQFEAWHCEKFKTRWQTGAPTRDMHNGVYADNYGPAEQQERWELWQAAIAACHPVRIYGCCAQPEGELHTAECPNMRHLAARQPVDEVSVKKEDANNYCLILRALGMEEEGDPVAEVQALIEARDHQPVGEPAAWVHEEDPERVISARQKATALRDQGASGSSVRPYSVPAYLHAPVQAVNLAPTTIPDTPEVREILGSPNFWCSPWANVLRMRGDEIPNKAEEEQAAVIRFMLNHYLASGADWAETAGAELDAIRKADSQAVGNG
ncbi:hypothetical protein [Stenotrophomonas maltophilia]|uniref:hypothetical protein n=1 Tax=Stenotrophomonas maltophilia TaxID=40324 RepID=UPI00066EEF6D|nr:hypothetical protein [Stenotrophomonas maltophilia]